MRGKGGAIFSSFEMSLEHSQLRRAILYRGLNDRTDQPFAELRDFIEMRVRGLRLEHPEFRQVAPRLGFFGAKRRAKRIHLPERCRRCLQVKLARLRKVSLFFIDVADFE